MIVSLLSSSLSNESARRELASAGADPRYTVAPDLQLGYSSLVIEVTGVGSTPQGAVHTAELVGAALTRQLERIQVSQGVNPLYMIRTQRVVAPDHPTLQVSGTLRPLVGVFAIGAILLLLVVSGADAADSLRTERNQRGLPKRDNTEIRSGLALRATVRGTTAGACPQRTRIELRSRLPRRTTCGTSHNAVAKKVAARPVAVKRAAERER